MVLTLTSAMARKCAASQLLCADIAREAGSIVSVAVIVAMTVNTEGQRQVIDMKVEPSEAETFWTEFLHSPMRRSLRGVKLVISDARLGLKAAAAKVPKATWQRCRAKLMSNALAHADKTQCRMVTLCGRLHLFRCSDELHDTFAFAMLAKRDVTGQAVAATPAMLMIGGAIGPVLGDTRVKAISYGGLGLAALSLDALAVWFLLRAVRAARVPS